MALYLENLDEDKQVEFKGKAKAFVRSYGCLSAILPYTNAEWEKLSIFLNFLIPKLPAPKEEDLTKGILEAIDMDSYRIEKKAAIKIQLPDQDVRPSSPRARATGVVEVASSTIAIGVLGVAVAACAGISALLKFQEQGSSIGQPLSL